MHRLIPTDWQLPESITTRLGDQAGRQRAMHHDGNLLLVLHEVPVPGQLQRQARLFWRRPAGAWDSDQGGGGGQALHRHLDHFAKAIEALEHRVESAASAHDYFAALQALNPLWRTVRHLHLAVQAAREAVPGDHDLIVLRDRAGDLERAVELLHHDADNGLDFTIASQGEELARNSDTMARASHRLNLLAALCLPLTALASVFGMELRSGLENVASPWPFIAVLATGLLIGFLLKGSLARRTAASADSGAGHARHQ